MKNVSQRVSHSPAVLSHFCLLLGLCSSSNSRQWRIEAVTPVMDFHCGCPGGPPPKQSHLISLQVEIKSLRAGFKLWRETPINFWLMSGGLTANPARRTWFSVWQLNYRAITAFGILNLTQIKLLITEFVFLENWWKWPSSNKCLPLCFRWTICFMPAKWSPVSKKLKQHLFYVCLSIIIWNSVHFVVSDCTGASKFMPSHFLL